MIQRGAEVIIRPEMWELARHHYRLREEKIRHRFIDPERNERFQIRSLVGEMCSKEALGERWDAMRKDYLVADRGDLKFPCGRTGDVKTPDTGLRYSMLLYNQSQFVDNIERYGLDSIVWWGAIKGEEPHGTWQFLGHCSLAEIASYPVNHLPDNPNRAARRVPKANLRDWEEASWEEDIFAILFR